MPSTSSSHGSSFGTKKSKKDPRNVTKEVAISAAIAEHDLATKVQHMREFLEKTYNVKLYVETKAPRHAQRVDDRDKQLALGEDIEKELESVAVKVGKESFHGRRLVIMFKSIL